MSLPAVLLYIRLLVRLLPGVLLVSVGASKITHLRQFQQGIKDYKLLPSALETKSAFSIVLAIGIPLAELLTGLGLISGFWLVPCVLLAMVLFVMFSLAMSINLLRGRRDLSCHCGGMVGTHLISWWLVGRNSLFIVCLLALLFTPPDTFTVASFVRSPSLLNASFVSIIVPVAVVVGAVIAMILLCNAARVLWRS